MCISRRGLLVGSLAAAAAAIADGAEAGGERRERKPLRGPIFNQDDSEFAYVRGPEAVSAEAVDLWVDELAAAGVGTLITCVCAMTTNYASRVWEPRWARYDPTGPDDQPLLAHLPRASVPAVRRWVEAEKRLADLGVNFHARAHARCHQRGIGHWLSIRMNDLHDCDLPDSPLLSTFYKSQRDAGKLRVPYRLASWPDRALDYLRPEVRDHYMALIEELLATTPMDGLELDFMRFGYHFPVGREAEGGRVLTGWLGEVRERCRRAGVMLGARVPSTPETARDLGLDGAAWARAGLIDLLVPTPFWATCEFGMPIGTWRETLEGTGVALAGGLEIRYQPHPGATAEMMTADRALGAATAVLTDGADAVYLFNYFLRGHLEGLWTAQGFRHTLSAMARLRTSAARPRRHCLTFRDVRAPGEPSDDPLPATGARLAFRLRTGPKPARGASVVLGATAHIADPSLRVNGVLCASPARRDGFLYEFAVPSEALADECHVLEVESRDGSAFTLVRVEFAVA